MFFVDKGTRKFLKFKRVKRIYHQTVVIEGKLENIFLRREKREEAPRGMNYKTFYDRN